VADGAWLRINRVLRAMLHERWSAEAWPQVKAEFKKALALKSQIRRPAETSHGYCRNVQQLQDHPARIRLTPPGYVGY